MGRAEIIPVNLIRIIPAEEIEMLKYFLVVALYVTLFPLYAKETSKEILTVYTYAAYTSPYGAGPYLKEAFEKTCHCEIQYVAPNTLPLVLNRLYMEGDKTKADVILGLEDIVLKDVSPFIETLTPYASNCLAFVYDSEKVSNPPQSLDELINSSYSIILQDPRTSLPGLGFLIWMKKAYGERAVEKWKKLHPHVLTYTKGWSEAYSLFKKGAAPIVLSYSTSPLYHEIQEGKTHLKALTFSEGHICSQMYAGKIKTTAHSALADQFNAFLLSKEAQHLIAIHGWVYPKGEIPEKWLKAKTFQRQPTEISYTAQEIADSQKAWINEWIEGLMQ